MRQHVIPAVLAAGAWTLLAAQPQLRPSIVFVSTRDNPSGTLADASEIYLMDADGTNPRRLTNNQDGDSLPAISPDGSRIVFDSNRLRAAGQPANTTQLFLMNVDGSEQKPLTWGSSASWSPDGKQLAFHASASGAASLTRVEPGAPASDSDIFVTDVEDLLKKSATPRNLTNSPTFVDDDADWSPDGRLIVYTRRAAGGRASNATNDPSAEIYVINADGSGSAVRLTANDEEERAPAWSPDGKRILYVARKGGPDFELCVMNADGTGQTQLTDNTVGDLTSSWSLDGRQIVFHRIVSPGRFQLFTINADGTSERQLTDTAGLNGFPKWGNVLVGAAGQLVVAQRPVVVFETEKGSIEIELDAQHAPQTAANFLKYVDGGFYDGGVVNRAVRPDNTVRHDVEIQVIQIQIDRNRRREEFAPIPLERTSVTGLKHLDGAVSMARNGPDTATASFSIVIGDQPEMDFGGKRNPDGQGFAVFGRVTRGMDVVKAIQSSPTGQTGPYRRESLDPPIKILKAHRK